MSIFRTIGSWFAGVMTRHHMSRRDQMQRVVELLIESGHQHMADKAQAEADIQDAYAARWLTRT